MKEIQSDAMKILLTLIFVILSTPALAMPKSSGINVKFGFIRYLDDGMCELYQETKEIPLHLKETGFLWGYLVTTNKNSFTIYDIARAESPFKTVSSPDLKLRDNGYTLVSDPYFNNGSSICRDFWNDEGDPLGQQSLEIYVDGNLEETIEFTVVEPDKSHF